LSISSPLPKPESEPLINAIQEYTEEKREKKGICKQFFSKNLSEQHTVLHTFRSAPTLLCFWQEPEILSHLSHELLEPQGLLRYKTVAGAVVWLCLAAQ
jgi:hypothetical protein